MKKLVYLLNLQEKDFLLRFSGLHNCIFRGQEWRVEKDPNNPFQWRSTYICRQVKRSGHKKSQKEKCSTNVMNRMTHGPLKLWSGQVEQLLIYMRLMFATMYCHIKFLALKCTIGAIKATHYIQEGFEELDEVLEDIIGVLKDDILQIQSAVNLYNLCVENVGHVLCHLIPLARLSEQFGKDLLVLLSPGIATIWHFKARQPKLNTSFQTQKKMN